MDGSNNSKLKVKFAPDWVPFASRRRLDPRAGGRLFGRPRPPPPMANISHILAREEVPAEPTVQRMLTAAREKGFDTEPLVFRQ